MSRRVVVTGLGTVNPLGLDVETFWKAAQEGRSGIGEITHFDASHMKARIAGEIDDFDPEVYIERKEARRLDRYDQLFWASSHQALADAGISYEEDDPEAMRAGVSPVVDRKRVDSRNSGTMRASAVWLAASSRPPALPPVPSVLCRPRR